MLPQTEPFRIIADGAVELEAQVAEVELPKLRLGQGVAVTPARHQ
jgi:HlyD family secretion protein